MPMIMHAETLPPATKIVLEKIKKLFFLHGFYLSGGTALSLQLGHRESEDLDFFTQKPFSPQTLAQKLSEVGTISEVIMEEGTLNLFMDNVKLQFLHYPYNLLEKTLPWNDIYLSSIVDIACTKLLTISARGSKKDYIDLYVLLKQFSLKNLFYKLHKKYQPLEYNEPHILKSLVYFEDAENQPMPRLHMPIMWEEVKKDIEKHVKTISLA